MDMMEIFDRMEKLVPSQGSKSSSLRNQWEEGNYNDVANEAVEILKKEIIACQRYGALGRAASAKAMLRSIEWSIRTKVFTQAGSELYGDWSRNVVKAKKVKFLANLTTSVISILNPEAGEALKPIIKKTTTPIITGTLTGWDIITNKYNTRKHLIETTRGVYNETKMIAERIVETVQNVTIKVKDFGEKLVDKVTDVGKRAVVSTRQFIDTAVVKTKDVSQTIMAKARDGMQNATEKVGNVVKNGWKILTGGW